MPTLSPPPLDGLSLPVARWFRQLWDTLVGDSNLDSTRGTVANTTGVQTLTNKTLTSPTITTPTVTVAGWTAPTFTSTWVNFGGGLQPVGYYKDPTGRVWLRGLMKLGTAAASAFTLPVGYRPTAQILFICSANNGAGDTAARLDVNTNGTVVPGTTGTTHFSLDGVSFLTT